MPFAEDQHPVGDLLAGGEHEPFRISVRLRERTGVLMMRTPLLASTSSNTAVNLLSRSRMGAALAE